MKWRAMVLAMAAVVVSGCGVTEDKRQAEEVAGGCFQCVKQKDFEGACAYYSPKFFEPRRGGSGSSCWGRSAASLVWALVCSGVAIARKLGALSPAPLPGQDARAARAGSLAHELV